MQKWPNSPQATEISLKIYGRYDMEVAEINYGTDSLPSAYAGG